MSVCRGEKSSGAAVSNTVTSRPVHRSIMTGEVVPEVSRYITRTNVSWRQQTAAARTSFINQHFLFNQRCVSDRSYVVPFLRICSDGEWPALLTGLISCICDPLM